jgi:ABC-type multidrug transport system fused ATPase/permease subunit
MAKARARTAKSGSLQKKLFGHALNQEVGYSDVIGSGGLERVTNAQSLLDLATDLVPDLLTSLVRLITTLYLMLYMNSVITLFALSLLFLTNWIILKPLAQKGQMLRIIKFKVWAHIISHV